MYRDAAYQPPGQAEAVAAAGGDRKVAQAVFRRLVDDGLLVRMAGDLFVHREAYERMKATLGEHLKAHGKVSVPGFKDLLGCLANTIPFLSTSRRGPVTRIRGRARAVSVTLHFLSPRRAGEGDRLAVEGLTAQGLY
jgi:hypothetical protein